MRTEYTFPPSLDDLEVMALRAFTTVPEDLRRLVSDVVIRIEDFPDEETVREMELDSAYDLLGLYRGVGIGGRDGAGTPSDTEMIHLYRRPILDYWCETGEDLEGVVRHVLVHEIGHHFGLSDEDMERIENDA